MVGAPLVYTGRWHIESDDGERVSSFPTWREALSYADRMARTVQVEIPRESYCVGRYTLRSHQAGIQIRHKDWPKKRGEMTIAHTDTKALALALLAHHYRNQQACLTVTYYMPDGKKEKHTANTQHLDQHTLQLLANYYEQEQA